MARPRKQTVDYFPHMCNHGKTIYILEQQYQARGYAFWFKLLEELGKKEGHCLDLSDQSELEFLSAKTWFSVTETIEVLDLLARLGAIDQQLWDKRKVWVQKFVDNLFAVYDKRVVSAPEKPVSDTKTIVSSVRNPHSRVEYSIGKDTNNTSEQSSHEDPINKVFNVFYETINPSINYGNKTSRKAAEWMVAKWGLEDVLRIAEYACSVHGKPYAPTITTPYQLKEKVSALKAYKDKEDKNKQGITVI